MENVGKPIGKAMLDNGYAPTTAKNPDHLTESKGWEELMNKYLPDDKLLTVHERALDATKIHGSMTEPDKEVPDIPTQLRAVELGYKVKKKLLPETMNTFNAGEMTLEFIQKPNESK